VKRDRRAARAFPEKPVNGSRRAVKPFAGKSARNKVPLEPPDAHKHKASPEIVTTGLI
jgi:hypothetical protein